MNKQRRDFLKATALTAPAILLLRRDNILGAAEALELPETDWSFYDRQQFATRVVIHALDYELGPESGRPGQDLAIYADTVRIRGGYHFPGTKLFIHARKVVAEKQSLVDVSGADVLPAATFAAGDRAAVGPTPGAGGTDGTVGGPGHKAGAVWVVAETIDGDLTVRANGGIGGRGQDGGAGAVGSVGPEGAWNRCGTGAPGGKGGTGGAPGKGGRGGSGGDGGHIEVQIVRPGMVAYSFSSKGGKGGAGGDHGHPGSGGPPGIGGGNGREIWGETRAGGSKKIGCEYCCGRTGANLGAGDTPAEIAAPSGSDGDGTSHPDTVASVVLTSSYDYLANAASLIQLSMSLHQAEMTYLRGDTRASLELLTWLERLTRNAFPPATAVPDPFASPYNVRALPTAADWTGIHNRVVGLLQQLATGLDYYGLPYNYVPLVSYGFYKASLPGALATARRVEDQYQLYKASTNDAERRRQALSAAIGAAEDSIRDLRTQISSLIRGRQDIQREITDLLASLQTQEQQLLQTDAAFQAAVQRQNAGRCDLIKTLQLVYTVVTVAAGAYENASHLADIVSGAADDELRAQLKKNGSLFVQQLKAVSADVDSLAKGYAQLAAAFPADRDAGKLLVRLDDFEKTIQPYLALPEAVQYRDQMRAFVETAGTRNQKVIDFQALIIKQTSLETEAARRESEINRLSAAKADLLDPGSVEYRQFMWRLASELKTNLLRQVHQERRAWEYWALRDAAFDVSDETVTTLEAVHSRLLTTELDVRNERTRPTQLIHDVTVTLSQENMSAAFAAFRSSGVLGFAIPLDHPAFRFASAAITAKQVVVRLPGIMTGDGLVRLTLTHRGRSQFKDPHGATRVFSHAPRATVIVFPIAGGAGARTETEDNLGGKDDYAPLSPFAAWDIDVSETVNPGRDLSKVTAIHLVFDVYFLPMLRT